MRFLLNKHIHIFLVGLLLLPVKAQSETKNQSVFELVNLALENNSELQVYNEEVSASRGDLFTAGRMANPSLSINVGRRDDSQLGTHIGSGPSLDLSFSQTFEYPGRIQLREAIANKQIDIAEIELQKFKRALAYKIKSLAFQLYLAQEQKKATQVVTKRGKNVVSVLAKREAPSVALQLERSIIDASVLTLNQRAISVAADVEKLSFEINQLCGRPNGEIITIGSDQFSKLPLVPNDDTLVEIATNENPDIRLKKTLLSQQDLKVVLSMNQRNPSFTLSPFLSEDRAGGTERIVGLGISVPLPIWNDNSGEIQSQEAKKTQSEYALKSIQNEIEKEIRSRAVTYRLRSAELTKLNANVLSVLRESAKKAEEHYQQGAVPVATYLQIQQQYVDGVAAITGTKTLAFEDAAAIELLTGLDLLSKPDTNQYMKTSSPLKRNKK